jgi:hypothetical protein
VTLPGAKHMGVGYHHGFNRFHIGIVFGKLGPITLKKIEEKYIKLIDKISLKYLLLVKFCSTE